MKLDTGSQALNKLLDGGYLTNGINLIYGSASTGKTCCCLLVALSLIKQDKKVIFIDTENGFSIERIKQLDNDFNESFLENLILFRPKSLDEQQKYVENILKIINKSNVSLVIVDTIGSLYRVELKREDANKANKSIDIQMKILSQIIQENKIPVLLTNQVYTDIETGRLRLVGGNMVKNWVKCLVRLEKNIKGRTAVLEKHQELTGSELRFEIRNEGIFEIGKVL